jgi:hypothetical protein
VRELEKYAKSYLNNDPQKILEAVEMLKKKTNLQPCLDQQHHVTPLVVSVDGQGSKNGYQDYHRESSTKYWKGILPPLWISSARLSITFHNLQ